jgi:hypothetical protein
MRTLLLLFTLSLGTAYAGEIPFATWATDHGGGALRYQVLNITGEDYDASLFSARTGLSVSILDGINCGSINDCGLGTGHFQNDGLFYRTGFFPDTISWTYTIAHDALVAGNAAATLLGTLYYQQWSGTTLLATNAVPFFGVGTFHVLDDWSFAWAEFTDPPIANPEPATWLLLATGLVMFVWQRRRDAEGRR